MAIRVSQPSGQSGAVGGRKEVRKRRRKHTEFIWHPSGLAVYRKLVKVYVPELNEVQLTGITGMLEPLEIENLGCFSCTHFQITHSFCLLPFSTSFFYSGKFHINVSYQPLYSSLSLKGSIAISQTWLVPTWVLGYAVTFQLPHPWADLSSFTSLR